MFEKITPDIFPEEGVEIVKKLLTLDPAKRLTA